MPASLRHLHHLAQLYGVQTSYTDVQGERRAATPESLLAVLQAMRVDVASLDDVPQALAETQRSRSNRGIEPVLVAWEGEPTIIDLRLPAGVSHGPIECRLELESGEVQTTEHRLDDFPTLHPVPEEGNGRVAKRLQLHPGIPLGYHRLTLRVNGHEFTSSLISAPTRAWMPPHKGWGVFLPLYALRSQQNWGAGNFSDLEHLSNWIAEAGGDTIATLPLLAGYLDEPFDPSPYSPISRQFWSEFYIDVEHVPDLEQCEEARRLVDSSGFRQEIDDLRRLEYVDYRRLMALKRRVLELLAARFFEHKPARFQDWSRFAAETPDLERYAAFRATQEKLRSPWTDWPERLREGDLRSGDYDESAKQYHLYAQWIASEQLRHLSHRSTEAGAGLYLDLPLGVRGDGYDVWRRRDQFVTTASAGAPPDALFTGGQDWGFCPLHPEAIRERGYAHFIDYIRHHLKFARALRIDHVMCLHRLFWIPRGMPAKQGVYVQYRSEEFYAILCLESCRSRVAIVGENLGTVPPQVNKSMSRHGIQRMYVVQYEFNSDPEAEDVLKTVPRACVASANTHDMPPFAAFWKGDDIIDRQDLGLIDEEETRQEQRARGELRRRTIAWLHRQGLMAEKDADARAVLKALLERLASSPAQTVLVNLEDLWLEERSQNVPGTSEERPNWRRKARFAFEEIRDMPEVVELLGTIDRLRKRGGRRSPRPQRKEPA